MAAPDQEDLPPDPDVDNDSSFDANLEPSLHSIRSIIKKYTKENGRTYHALSAGKYNYPNDEEEAERLDIQHHIWVLTFDGKLALNPGQEKARRVMDMGTGTGIWAIDFADEHPDAEVIGVDLSPIQPSFVPTNCSFEIDDLEKEWTWSKPFDFIMCRAMAGSFANYPKMIAAIYENLAPGGYFEIQDLSLPLACDDGSLPEDSALHKWHTSLYEASQRVGRPLDSPAKFIPEMKAAGFTEIQHEQFKWPTNHWPSDKKHKELGRLQSLNLSLGLEAFSLALLTRVMDWSRAEVIATCAAVRKDIRNTSIHAYWNIHVVYGKKPDTV